MQVSAVHSPHTMMCVMVCTAGGMAVASFDKEVLW